MKFSTNKDKDKIIFEISNDDGQQINFKLWPYSEKIEKEPITYIKQIMDNYINNNDFRGFTAFIKRSDTMELGSIRYNCETFQLK